MGESFLSWERLACMAVESATEDRRKGSRAQDPPRRDAVRCCTAGVNARRGNKSLNYSSAVMQLPKAYLASMPTCFGTGLAG